MMWSRCSIMLLLVQAVLVTADISNHIQQRNLRILAVPLLPTSPTMDMMAVMVEMKAR